MGDVYSWPEDTTGLSDYINTNLDFLNFVVTQRLHETDMDGHSTQNSLWVKDTVYLSV